MTAGVSIIRTGVANLASVVAAFRRLDTEPVVTADAGAVEEAGHVVLPGVGAFGAGMEALAGPLADALRGRVAAGRPTLAICLGMQLLCEASDEAPGVRGLGVLPGTVGRYGDHVTVPQMGWARVTAGTGARVVASGYAYFANSYRLAEAPPGWAAATGDHGGTYVAAVERGAVVACQFHPELSGAFGLELIRRWMRAGAGPA
jgi:imidazole glycerol phosphate synthase glutamine amidotransferase subunit